MSLTLIHDELLEEIPIADFKIDMQFHWPGPEDLTRTAEIPVVRPTPKDMPRKKENNGTSSSRTSEVSGTAAE